MQTVSVIYAESQVRAVTGGTWQASKSSRKVKCFEMMFEVAG